MMLADAANLQVYFHAYIIRAHMISNVDHFEATVAVIWCYIDKSELSLDDY